jgi:hypothetical protein
MAKKASHHVHPSFADFGDIPWLKIAVFSS